MTGWLVVLAAVGAAAWAQERALRIDEGSVARRQLVGVGRDVEVAGEALSDVAAINGSVEVSGTVDGDVVVLGGNARLAPGSRVDGDVFALGGEISAEGATIGGRAVSYPTVSAAWLTLLEGPSLGLSATSPLVVGAKLALLCGWLSLVLLLFASTGRQLLSTSESVAHEPFRNFAIGLTAVLNLVLIALFFASFAVALVGLPFLFLLVLLALLLRLWGMVAVFHALGAWVGQRLFKQPVGPLHAATLGLVLLGIAKLVPWVGVWTWTAATLIGVGATLATKFGRREPWFESA